MVSREPSLDPNLGSSWVDRAALPHPRWPGGGTGPSLPPLACPLQGLASSQLVWKPDGSELGSSEAFRLAPSPSQNAVCRFHPGLEGVGPLCIRGPWSLHTSGKHGRSHLPGPAASARAKSRPQPTPQVGQCPCRRWAVDHQLWDSCLLAWWPPQPLKLPWRSGLRSVPGSSSGGWWEQPPGSHPLPYEAEAGDSVQQ